MTLAASVAAVALVLFAAAGAGSFAAPAILPPGRSSERAGWGLFLGIAGLAASAAVGLVLPGLAFRGVAAIVFAALVAAPAVLRLPRAGISTPPVSRWRAADAALAGAVGLGILLYAIRALTEPMWSNDFLAIWGLKGKTIAAARALPFWPFRDPAAAFSHPEYPVGLPLVFAGIAGVIGRWDDHGTALLFPAIQAATLAVLYGWLRRRGASRRIALTTTALVAWCEPLYSAFLTGMADIPLAGILLLLATSWCDALDRADPGASRRLVVASLLAAAIKNEGLFCAAACAALALLARRAAPVASRLRVAAACLLPAAAVWLVHRLALGSAALRDFDPGLLLPARLSELPARAVQAAAAVMAVAWRPAWPALLALAAIGAAGRRSAAGDRILALAAVALGAYLALPLLAVRGPDWLVRTTLPRTAAALVPMVAAGLALRASSLPGQRSACPPDAASAGAAGPTASARHDAPPTPSIPAS